MSRIEAAFDAVLNGEHDEVCIQCENKKIQESVRSQANAVKRKMKDDVVREIFGVGKTEINGVLQIRIYRKVKNELLVLGKDGKMIPFVKMEGIVFPSESTREERVEILRGYGKPEKVINEFLDKQEKEERERELTPQNTFTPPPESYLNPEKPVQQDFIRYLVNPEEWGKDSPESADSKEPSETSWKDKEVDVRKLEKEEMMRELLRGESDAE
jgi:hypothetical protein